MYLDAGVIQGYRNMGGCMEPQGVFVFVSSFVYNVSIKLSVARLVWNCRQGTLLIKNICLGYFTTKFLFWRCSSFYLIIYLLNRKILLKKITQPNIKIWKLFGLLFIPRQWLVWILFLTSLLCRKWNDNVILVYLSNRLFVLVHRYFTGTKESFLSSQDDNILQLFLSYIWTGILWKSFVISLNLLLWPSSVCIEHLSPKSLGIYILRNKLEILFQST